MDIKDLKDGDQIEILESRTNIKAGDIFIFNKQSNDLIRNSDKNEFFCFLLDNIKWLKVEKPKTLADYGLKVGDKIRALRDSIGGFSFKTGDILTVGELEISKGRYYMKLESFFLFDLDVTAKDGSKGWEKIKLEKKNATIEIT
jgi:hypothetical protein